MNKRGRRKETDDYLERYSEVRATLQEVNSTVVRPIPRLDRSVISKRTKTKRYTPERMRNGINRYFAWCETHDEVPSIKGMTIFLKLYPNAFYEYVKYPEFRDMMEHARLIISDWAEKDVWNTRGLAAGKIAYMKNVHGWAEKMESKQQIDQRVITKEEALSKIEMLAPKLLELLQRNNVVNQLAQAEDAVIVEDTDA